MSKVGIIANPAAGKDIRRLVAYASLTSNTPLVIPAQAGIQKRSEWQDFGKRYGRPHE